MAKRDKLVVRDGIEIDPQYLIEIDGVLAARYIGLLDAATKYAEKNQLVLCQHEPKVACAPSSYNNQTTVVVAGFYFTDHNGDIKEDYWGVGDANPDNVDEMIEPHCPRMAETRAKGRALRDALRVPVVAAEELFRKKPGASRSKTTEAKQHSSLFEQFKAEATKVGINGRAGLLSFMAETLNRDPESISYESLTDTDIQTCLDKVGVLKQKEVTEVGVKGTAVKDPTKKPSKAGIINEIFDLYKEHHNEKATKKNILAYISTVLEKPESKCESKLLKIEELVEVRDSLLGE